MPQTKTAFLFPGSGVQHVGMGRALRDAFPAIEKNLRKIDETLGRALSSAMDGPKAVIFPRPDSAQLNVSVEVTIALSLAVAGALKQAGAAPDALAGRSMGEYGAASLSGVFSAKDCFQMVRAVALKGQVHCLKTPGSLVTVYGLDRKELRAVADGMGKDGHFCEVVSFYDKPRVGVAGLRNSSLAELKARLAPFRHRLSVSKEAGAFHSALLDRLTPQLRRFFEKIDFSSPALPLYMNLDGALEPSPAAIRTKLASAVSRPVLWQETIRNMLADGVRTFVELAPGAMLTEFICDLPPDAKVLRTDTPENFRRALRRLTRR